VPTPVTPESVAPPPVSKEPVREVPNMRVLAPALVRPEPAETAPPTGSAPASGATGSASASSPAAKQTASVPKVSAPPSAATGPYRVQLSSVRSEARAEREWARLQKAFPDLFGDRSLVVEKKEIAGRGTFYRVQTGGYKTLADARAVCNSLKAKKQGCLPIKR
jgi:cell division protein FtsN